MRRTLLLTASILAITSPALADVKVVASIKPVHSLVAAVMQGVGTPGLLVDGANSPHTYTMKPSDAEMLSSANVVFWIGHDLEAFLEKPIESLGEKAKAISLMEAEGMLELPLREGDGFDAHDHDHGHAHGEHEHGENEHGEHDAHVWLDPENAKAMVRAIAATLSASDPANAAKYTANADATLKQLDGLSTEIATGLKDSQNSFIVFHDAYQYFEKRFGISAAGAISIHPENPPGAKGIRDIRKRLKNAKVSCVYAEPQFDNKLVNVIIDGTDVKTGVLDPLGANIEPGPALYFTLLRDLANNIKSC